MADTILDRQSVPEGKVIFEEGDQGNYAYIIESGEVEISKMINISRQSKPIKPSILNKTVDKELDDNGPPFGVHINSTIAMFSKYFTLVEKEIPALSIERRRGREVFVIFKKNGY